MLIDVRNKLNSFLYSSILKPVFFMIDPELMHKFFIQVGRSLGSNPVSKAAVSAAYNYQDRRLEQTLGGMKFRNPVGLAAGFDKNAECISVMEDVGFGFVEVGSVTAKSCKGNNGVRLKRLINHNSLWVHLGLNNKGADEVAKKLRKGKFKIPVAVSIAKTNSPETTSAEPGMKDYLYSVRKFENKANYIVLNISCPNSYGGLSFSEPPLFEMLMKEIKKMKIRTPIFIKMSPDLSRKNIDKIVSLSEKYGVMGFICSNLTKKHNLGKGGLSGKIVEKRSEEMLSHIYKKTKGKFILIGVGGIFSAEDAYRKIKLGANLVQLITGMIYRGPSIIGEINYDLLKLLEKDGYKNVSEAVGKGL